MLAQQVHSDGTWTRCTGTLISSTVFLTAAHCEIPGATQVKVTFDSAFTFPGTTFTGTWHADPAFTLRVYAHALQTMQQDATEQLGAALFGNKTASG